MANNPHPILGNGKICYLQIPALDVDKSAAFYTKVFGWKVRRRDDGTLAFDDGVAATIDTLIAHGGKLVQPIGADAPEITARFSDPAGNVLGLYQEPAGKSIRVYRKRPRRHAHRSAQVSNFSVARQITGYIEKFN